MGQERPLRNRQAEFADRRARLGRLKVGAAMLGLTVTHSICCPHPSQGLAMSGW